MGLTDSVTSSEKDAKEINIYLLKWNIANLVFTHRDYNKSRLPDLYLNTSELKVAFKIKRVVDLGLVLVFLSIKKTQFNHVYLQI